MKTNNVFELGAQNLREIQQNACAVNKQNCEIELTVVPKFALILTLQLARNRVRVSKAFRFTQRSIFKTRPQTISWIACQGCASRVSCRDRCIGARGMRRRRGHDVAAAGAAGGATGLPTAVVRWPPRTHQDILHVSNLFARKTVFICKSAIGTQFKNSQFCQPPSLKSHSLMVNYVSGPPSCSDGS